MGVYSNHSGKVTCASALFGSRVDEQLIKRQTGHRSDAVRAYKTPFLEQDVAVSNILQPPPEKLRKEEEPEQENISPGTSDLPCSSDVSTTREALVPVLHLSARTKVCRCCLEVESTFPSAYIRTNFELALVSHFITTEFKLYPCSIHDAIGKRGVSHDTGSTRT